MSDVRVIEDREEQLRLIKPIWDGMGKQFPDRCVAFAEFDVHGEVIAVQLLQESVFFEGLWAKTCKCHLRTVWNKALGWLREREMSGKDVLTMAADDKVARAAVAMGCELLPWKVLRRKV